MKGHPPKERKPFMAINDLSRIFHHRLRALADGAGLNESYRHLLFHLSREDGVTQLELARSTNLKPPTISVTLQKMEREGYIERTPDENDMRAMRVYLTEKGRSFDVESRKVVTALDAQAVQGMSEEEIRTLMELLDRMYFNITGRDPKQKCCHKRNGGKSK